jgi:hypothetical protein
MVFAFQSSGSLMSDSCRSRSRRRHWDRVREGQAAVPGTTARLAARKVRSPHRIKVIRGDY